MSFLCCVAKVGPHHITHVSFMKTDIGDKLVGQIMLTLYTRILLLSLKLQ